MLRSSSRALAEEYDLGLVDLDGVVYLGPEPVEHAVSGLRGARDAGMEVVFVTNNASREPEAVAEQLRELGIVAEVGDVLTSAQAAVALLGTVIRPGGSVLVVGGPGLVAAVRDGGYRMVDSADDAPDAVIQGFGPEVGWRELTEASYAVCRGARYVVTNRDVTQPKERGIAPGNGTLVAVVVATTGVEPLSAGKPEPTMFRLAAQVRSASRPLVIGDRLDTDLGAARAAGFDGLLVFTGVSRARDAILAPPEQRPDYLGVDLRSLLVPHPAPAPAAGGWWVCNDAAARVVDRGMQVFDDGADPLDLARAACAAAWEAADDAESTGEAAHGGTTRGVDPERVPDLRVV
jgi:glycerol 3-phosphatase-2